MDYHGGPMPIRIFNIANVTLLEPAPANVCEPFSDMLAVAF
jgi:hypothetical protein